MNHFFGDLVKLEIGKANIIFYLKNNVLAFS